MNRKVYILQSVQTLRALAVIIVMIFPLEAWADSLGTFSDLRNEIGSGGDIVSHDSYKYDVGDGDVIEITSPGTINGCGATIDMGGSNISVFNIVANNVIIKNLIIKNASNTAIVVLGDNCIIENCTFIGNNATNSSGAIYVIGKACTIKNCAFINNGETTISYSSSIAPTVKDNWFGNTADDYKTAPATGVQMENWLFLDAIADPPKILKGESSEVVFRLYSYDGNSVSEYDKMDVRLNLSQTLGTLDKVAASLGEEITYTASEVGQAGVTATFGTVSYTVDILNAVSTGYIDVDGNKQTAMACPLNGSETTLGKAGEETWYVCNSDVTYDHALFLNGNVHLILCDGSAMKLTDNNIHATNLTIYGQSNGTGTLTGIIDVTANCFSAPDVTVRVNTITVNGDVTAGSLIATKLTATNHKLTLTGTGSEIGTTGLGTGTLTVNANAGGNVGKLTAGTVNVNKGGDLTATNVTNLSSLTVTGGTLSLGETSDLSGASVTLAEDGVIRTSGGALMVGSLSGTGTGTIQGKDGIVLLSSINNPNLNIVAETKDIDATGANVTNIKAKSLTATDGNIDATGKDITAGTISAKGEDTAKNITDGTISTNGVVTAKNIILWWKDPEDFFYASSYNVPSDGTVKIYTGTYLGYTDGSETTVLGSADADYVFGEGSNATLANIAGKRLVPAVPFKTDNPYVVKTFNGNRKVAGGAKTFLPTGYDLSAVQVTLAEVKGAPDGLPVIIGPKDEKNPPATFFLVVVQSDEVKTIQEDYDNVAGEMSKRFVITDGEMTLSKVIEQTGVDASEAIILVLANGKFTSVDFSADDLEKNAKPGLLLFVLTKWEYMQIKPATQPASATLSTRAIGIDFGGETTGIKNVHNVQSESYYDLQGRCIAQPTRKGFYIRNGKKIIIK